jgi:aminopeptidase N
MAHDTDPFNKWEAARGYGRDLLARMILEGVEPETAFLDALRVLLLDETLDPAFRALASGLPSEDDLAQEIFDRGPPPDPLLIHNQRKVLSEALAGHLSDDLASLYASMNTPGPYSPDSKAAGRRSLRTTALALTTWLDQGAKAKEQFMVADNMTEQLSALGLLVSHGVGEEALERFYSQWSGDRLVIDKWFSLQANRTPPGQAIAVVKGLSAHEDFDWKNPNRLRSLVGAFAAGNPAGFHDASGAGYRLLSDWLIKLDPLNPQTTARLAGLFETWRRYDEGRQSLIRTELERIRDTDGLSKDTGEIVSRILEA